MVEASLWRALDRVDRKTGHYSCRTTGYRVLNCPIKRHYLWFCQKMFPSLTFGSHPTTTFQGSSKTLALNQIFSFENLLHEIAHYCIASPARREVDNYGLGGALDMSGSEILLSYDLAEQEEEMASLLGICFMIDIGLSPDSTLYLQGWGSVTFDSLRIRCRIAQLKGLGLLSDDGSAVHWGRLSEYSWIDQEEEYRETMY